MAIVDLLAKITKDGQASDIFIVAGRPLSYKSHGQIMTEGTDRLLPPDTDAMVSEIYTFRDLWT